MLHVENLVCRYGKIEAVSGISLDVGEGQIVALVGANGAGKSSTIQSIAGHVLGAEGRITLAGEDITALPPRERVRKGVAIAPEGRRLFRDLTVHENLSMGGFCRPREREAANLKRVLDLFPRLAERIHSRAENLSGGEQQMVTIGRAMMSEPRLLLIDELSLGLMPKNVDLCYEAILRLKREGLSILVVEQNTTKALQVADHAYVLSSGRLIWKGTAAEARDDPSVIQAYIGSSAH
ncbi:MAG: ABC transporter ATP-binding protein [Rhizobiales bacterium]|nr:ABC transporter ATP-binding protein [Hyphomicrobiales bacterium]